MIAAVFAFGLLIVAQAQAALPTGGRSWELTTQIPTTSSSGLVGMRAMGDDGEKYVIALLGPPAENPSGAAFSNGLSVRGSTSWLNAPLGVPYDLKTTQQFPAFVPIRAISFSEDLRTTLWVALTPLTPGAPPEGETALYRQHDGGALELISRTGGPGFEFIPFVYEQFADISGDGNRVVFTSTQHLLAADAGRTEGSSIYAWNGGSPQLVDVKQNGTLLSTCGATVSKSNGVSTSGTRVFFSVPASCNGLEAVYLRDLQSQTTVQISASHCARPDCNAAANVTFAGAGADGHVAYLTTTQQLTNEDEDSLRDLYSYNVDTGTLTLLSGGDATATGAVNSGIVTSAEVGDRVYFSAKGELLPGEPGAGEKLFYAEGGTVHLVAEASIPTFSEEPQIQLSRDGRQALFVTSAALQPSDTDGQADAYLYDSEGNELTSISTTSSSGNGAFPVIITAPSPVNQQEFEAGVRRPYYAIDAGGEHTFFQTEEALLPEDTNAKSDVYEFAHGVLGLVSPGNLPYKSDFAGISRDGRSAMFATNATLVSSDHDGGSRDLYDARLGGGFPEEPGSPPACDVASCPLPTQPRLARVVPPSALPHATKPVKKSGQLRLLDVASAAKKGAIALDVSVPAAGLVKGTIWTNQKGKRVVLAKGSQRAKAAGKMSLSLQLSAAAQQAPAVIQKAHVVVSSGGAETSEVVKVKLR